MSRKLYVGNFPYEVGETELQELFARAGTVETVKVMRDMATGRARGFAFVEMSTDEEAQKAITELNAYRDGRPRPHRQRSASQAGVLGRRWRRLRRRRLRSSQVRAALVTERESGGAGVCPAPTGSFTLPLRILVLPEPSLRDPLVADASEVGFRVVPPP